MKTSASGRASKAPEMDLQFGGRISTIEALRAAAREARPKAKAYAAEHGIADTIALGDASTRLLERCGAHQEAYPRGH
jgi:hypothetical protein